jgi:class 3 adenylate cyclase
MSPEALAKANARLERRLARLESNLESLEAIRDTNAGVLDRLIRDLEHERARSRELLLNVLPEAIVERLAAGETRIADRHESVAVVFSDFVGFTEVSSQLRPAVLVDELNELFSAFDAACERFGVEKIKTIGDAYLAASGLDPRRTGDAASGEPGSGPDATTHVAAAADLALAMQDAVAAADPRWQVRIGLHAGPVVAGVLGTKKFVYDVWGDTVNVASRLETVARPGTILASEAVASALGAAFELSPVGPVDLKGKGPVPAHLLLGRRASDPGR